MYSHAIAMSVASLLLALFAVLPGRVEAQNNTADPVAQPAAKPIGKVVAAAGSVTIEQAELKQNAVG